MAPLLSSALFPLLKTYFVGRHFHFLHETGSTNDLARSAAHNGDPDGSTWVADLQLKGRGRLGRTWMAPPGSSILCSLLLYPRFSPSRAHFLTIIMALAIKKGIAETGGLSCAIKWPNDILYEGLKLGGILSEIETTGEHLHFAIVGWGLNVNFDPLLYPEIASTATSLSAICGHNLDRTELLASILNNFEILYRQFETGLVEPIFAEWRASLITLGQIVQVSSSPQGNSPIQDTFEGLARDVDQDGALLVQTETGLKRVFAGDVTLRRL